MSNVLNGYELLEQIGHGATGRVWRAREIATGAVFAVKELRSELADDAEARVRFLNEGTVLAKRQPLGAVKVHRTLTDGVRVGLVMDLIDGPDLRQLMAAVGPLRPTRACVLAGQIAQTLADAHASDLIHRDVKPENVMIAHSESDTERALLMDFGLARVLEETPTSRSRSQTLGTPNYVAPEVLQGRHPGPPTDVYALGIVLFEMLAGWRPFRQRHHAALSVQHLTQQPMRPPQLDENLWAAISACLSKDPLDRPTADTLAGQLVALATQLEATSALTRTDAPTEQQMTHVKAALPPDAPGSSPKRAWAWTPRWVAAGLAGVVAVAVISVAASGVGTRTAGDAPSVSEGQVDETTTLVTPAPTAGTSSPGRADTSSASPASSATASPTSSPKPTKTVKPAPTASTAPPRNEATTGPGAQPTTSSDRLPTKKPSPRPTHRATPTPSPPPPRAPAMYGICESVVASETRKYNGVTYTTYRWSRCPVGSAKQVYRLYKSSTGNATTPIYLYNRNFKFNSGFVQHQWAAGPASWAEWKKDGWSDNNNETKPQLLGYGSTRSWSGGGTVRTWVKNGGKDNRNRYLQSWRQLVGTSLSGAGYRQERQSFYAPKK